MTTLVGTQKNFSKALQELAELDYDAVEAYKATIEKLENSSYKARMEEFKGDHERHIKEINGLLAAHDVETVKGPTAKGWLTEGKVRLANMVGDDNTILKAMLSNEEDTNTAYRRLNDHADKWADAIKMLERGLTDEKKHKEWIKKTIEENKG